MEGVREREREVEGERGVCESKVEGERGIVRGRARGRVRWVCLRGRCV